MSLPDQTASNDCVQHCHGTSYSLTASHSVIIVVLSYVVLIMDGMQGSHIEGCVIGCNTFIANGCHVEDCMLMGNDNYTNDRERERARQQGMSVLGIGRSNMRLSIS